jgi:hypothetical protein
MAVSRHISEEDALGKDSVLEAVTRYQEYAGRKERSGSETKQAREVQVRQMAFS